MGSSHFSIILWCCALAFIDGINSAVAPLRSSIEARDNNDWVPAGAPPMKNGEGIFDWIDRVVDKPDHAKRDYASDFVNPSVNYTYEKNTTYATLKYSGTLQYKDGPVEVQFERSIADSHTPGGVKPNTAFGPFIQKDGTRIDSAAFSDVVNEIYDIGKQYSAADSRYKAMGDLVQANANDLKNYYNICTNTTSLAQTSPYTEVIHDELRKLLFIESRPLSLQQFFFLSLGAATVGGPLIATVQTCISHAFGSLKPEEAFDIWVQKALRWGVTILVGIEVQKFVNMAGGPAVILLALISWFRTMALKLKNKVLGGATAGAAAVAAATDSDTCSDISQAETEASAWTEFPQDYVTVAIDEGLPLLGNSAQPGTCPGE